MAANAGYYVASAAIGYLTSQQNKPQAPQAPQAPTPPPQQAQAPQMQGIVAGLKGTGQAGGAGGVGSTFLTGPGGIDPNALKLGKTTLLGE